MKNLLIISIIFIFINCVGQEESIDGLSKNSPVVVNTSNAFTFTLRAESYTTEENYTLNFSVLNPIIFTTVLIVTDFAGRTSDTSYFNIFNSNDSLLIRYELNNNIDVEPDQNLEPNEIPNKIFLKADDFSGFVELTLVIEN